jgi:hypothetical protein
MSRARAPHHITTINSIIIINVATFGSRPAKA